MGTPPQLQYMRPCWALQTADDWEIMSLSGRSDGKLCEVKSATAREDSTVCENLSQLKDFAAEVKVASLNTVQSVEFFLIQTV